MTFCSEEEPTGYSRHIGLHTKASGRASILRKCVVSSTLVDSLWENTVFIKDNVVEEIRRLKQQDAPDLQVHGSSQLLQTLLRHDLVDELWLKIFPITLGTGKCLFGEGTIPVTFKLTHSEATPNGFIVVSYERTGDVKTGSVGA